MSAKRIPTIKIFDLEAFIATAESGSQTEAAKKLGCKQPTISRAITKLEEQSNLPLMISGELTITGQKFLPIAKQVIDLLGNGIGDLKRRKSVPPSPISGRDIKIGL